MKNACKLVASGAMVALGCSAPAGPSDEVEEVSQALDVCGETVPANRYVDGLPAYSQCAETMNSAIWSNNGIDTATSSQGPDWVRTQFSGGYQCTELAWRYMHFKWNVDYRSGNAGEWCDGRLPASLVKSTVPVHGDLIVFAPGACGADGTTGHIAVVDTVDMAGGNVAIVEENRAGRRNAKQSCATCFLHAVANDGSTTGSGGSSASGGAAGASSTGGGTAEGGATSASGGTSSSGGRMNTGGAGSAGLAGAATTRGGAVSAGGAVGNAGSSGSGGSPAAGGTSAGGNIGASGALASGGSVTVPSSGGTSATSGAAGTSIAGNASGATPGSVGGASSAGQPILIDPGAEEPGCSIGARGPSAAQGASVASWSWLLFGLLLRRRTPRPRR
jgi:hypothetical protein